MANYSWDAYQEAAEPRPRVTDRDIFDQLILSEGNISDTARQLGIPRPYVKSRIDSVPALQALKQDLVDEVLDVGETNVFNGVKRGDATDTRFLLQTLGKDRGWSQGVAGTGKNGEILVTINHLSGDKADGSA